MSQRNDTRGLYKPENYSVKSVRSTLALCYYSYGVQKLLLYKIWYGKWLIKVQIKDYLEVVV